ncbi:MAG: ABC transporter substrate-binding protein, partial [Mucilaginibacter sp.]
MTSARNRLPLLSGNRWLLLVCIALLAAACTPKLHPVVNNAPKTEPPVVAKEPEKPAAKPVAATTTSIAMLLPLELD